MIAQAKIFSVCSILAFVLIAAAPQALALDGIRDDIFNGFQANKQTVFVSQCGSPKIYLATLLFSPSENRWELVEEYAGKTVNLAGLTIEDGKASHLDTLGGIYTYERVGNLVGELIDAGFDLLAPFTVEKLRALKPRKEKCRYEEQEGYRFLATLLSEVY